MPLLSQPTPEAFLGIVDAIPDAVAVVDTVGDVRFANARAEVFFRRLRHQFVGRPAGELVPGLDLAVQQVLADRGPDERLELSAVRGSSGGHPVEVWLARVAVDDVEMVTVTIRDDRERRSLREASAQLRDELFASVSHELRTPLTSIIGSAELLIDLGEQALSPEALALISIIERNAERELRLVEDLLTLAALGASTLTVEPEPTDLVPLAEEVTRSLALPASKAGVELRCAPASADVLVEGDGRRLRQVVRALVCNAVKFTPTGGQVTVSLSAEAGHAVLEVEDQGVGVSAEELPRVFECLFRGTHAIVSHLPGAGLGLSIVKGVVDAHGGEVGVESEAGRGTRVRVRLPLVPEPAELPEAPGSPLAGPDPAERDAGSEEPRRGVVEAP